MGNASAISSMYVLFQAIFFGYAIFGIFIIWRRANPWWFAGITTAAAVFFYAVLALPLRTMWWGNQGDENLILAFLTQTIRGNFSRDFFYAWLPPFYPPLYFWVTGLVARGFVSSSVGAAKVGVTGILLIWFAVPALFRAISKRLAIFSETTGIMQSTWFWTLMPFFVLSIIDFDAIITKPYEVFSALCIVLYAGLLYEALCHSEWGLWHTIFFGFVGGLLFLTFYFWMFIVLPVLFVLMFFEKNAARAFGRFVTVIMSIGVVASPYVIPFVLSMIRFGVENSQGHFFVPSDFVFFTPWKELSARGLFYVAGLAGLVWGSRRERIVRAALGVFAGCYAYQLFNANLFLLGWMPLQASKPFPFLAGACIAVGGAYAIVGIAKRTSHFFSPNVQKLIFSGVFLISLLVTPFVRFIGSPDIMAQVKRARAATPNMSLAEHIVDSVPDYADRTWLVSDATMLLPHLPLSYYIAYNQNFSHQASSFSERLGFLRALRAATTSGEFISLIDQSPPPQFDAMALYRGSKSGEYLLFFWLDAYPNGSTEEIIAIPSNLVTPETWKVVYEDREWAIFVRWPPL